MSDDIQDSAITYRLEAPATILLSTWLGTPIEVAVTKVVISDDRVDVTASTSWEHWHNVRIAGALHLDLTDFQELPDPGNPVQIEMALRDPYLAAFDEPDELFTELFDPDGSPLHNADAWLLCSAMQAFAVPNGSDGSNAATESGFRTQFARPW